MTSWSRVRPGVVVALLALSAPAALALYLIADPGAVQVVERAHAPPRTPLEVVGILVALLGIFAAVNLILRLAQTKKEPDE